MNLKTSENFKLFDSLVGSVLGYAGEVRGIHGGPDIERLHTQFCKSILGVQKSTNLAALYSELGRRPLTVFRKLRILKYWWKIIESGDIQVRNVYDFLYEDASSGRMHYGLNWAYQVKNMLDSLGVAYVWNNQTLHNLNVSENKAKLFDNVN